MKVAFDVGPLMGTQTGVGRYARELVESLEVRGTDIRRYAVALRGATDDSVARWRAPARSVQEVWRRTGRPAIERLVGDVDVVHATNFVLPALRSAAGVVTVHDLSFLRSDTFPGGERLRTLVPWSVERAARVITPTAAVADEVTDYFGVERERISATHEGVSPLFFGAGRLSDTTLADLGIRPPFAVAAGTIEPRKNLPRLLQAWRRAADQMKEWTLVLAGPRGWGPELPETPGVVLTGWIGDETLPGLLSAADLFCYPSLYEGFGLPPLEAMATGTAVVAGDYPCAREVLGDAALIVDATDVEALAQALIDLADDPGRRKSLGYAGKARASGFTWERTATQTLAAYEAAVSQKDSSPRP
ncbi:MAG: glycosyltransferase family 4 protein [Actinomycetota bacterium]|nr:glycosyltransferase family 4 protein [Actinomycetota bacterium]